MAPKLRRAQHRAQSACLTTPKLRCTEAATQSASSCEGEGTGASPVGCEYHRGSRRPSLANRTRALFGLCGCSQSFPASGTYARQLSEWAHVNPSKLNTELLEMVPAAARASQADNPSTSEVRGACLSLQCIASKRLAGRWILFMGDSTQRNLHDAFLKLLGDHFGMDSLTVQPHLDGLPVKDRDKHKDYDSVFVHPPRDVMARWQGRGAHRKGKAQREPECYGPLYPECAGKALSKRPDLRWWANATARPSTRVSMRFLRGLDAHKMERNARDWRERFFYKEWRQRTRDQPPNLLFGSQTWRDHPVTSQFWARTPEPDAIIFNSCAWDLPQVGASPHSLLHAARNPRGLPSCMASATEAHHPACLPAWRRSTSRRTSTHSWCLASRARASCRSSTCRGMVKVGSERT